MHFSLITKYPAYAAGGGGCISTGSLLRGILLYDIILPNLVFSQMEFETPSTKMHIRIIVFRPVRVRFSYMILCNISSINSERSAWGAIFFRSASIKASL
jgi:hypothetical protein